MLPSVTCEIDSRNFVIQRKSRGDEPPKHQEEIFWHQGSTLKGHSGMSVSGDTSAMSGIAINSSLKNSIGNQPSINWNVGTKVKIRTSLGASRSEHGSGGQVLSSLQIDSNPDRGSGSPKVQVQTTVNRSRIEESAPQARPQQSVSNGPPKGDESDESDGGIALNLANDEESDESGEVHESPNQGFDGQNDMEVEAETPIVPDDEISVQDEQTDAMMDYSEAHPNSVFFKSADKLRSQEDRVQTLAELEPYDLQLQLRYFYISQDPRTVDLTNPVRCLLCSGEHTSNACITKLVQGNKDIIRRPRIDVKCDLCSEFHLGTCEMFWRTSGFRQNVQDKDIWIHLSCYECGKDGHLGNDCPIRRPRKAMGSSTWSMAYDKQSSNGISIRGRADQKKPIVIDDSDDDLANFHRPHLPPSRGAPTRAAINNTIILSHKDEPRLPPKPPRSRPYEPLRRRSRSHSPALSNCSNQAVADFRTFRSRDDTPRSHVSATDEQAGPSKTAKKKAALKKKKKIEAVNSYRPMPSAARDAWKRHRI